MIQGMGCSDFGNNSGAEALTSISSLTGLPHPEPHPCSTDTAGKVRWARRGFTCCPEYGLAFIHSIPISFYLLSGGRLILDLLDMGVLVAVPVSVSGRAAHGSTSQTFFMTPGTFTFLFPLINLPPEQILTLFLYFLCKTKG